MGPRPQQVDARDKSDRWHRCLQWLGEGILCKWHLQGSTPLQFWNAASVPGVACVPQLTPPRCLSRSRRKPRTLSPFRRESLAPWECPATAVSESHLSNPCIAGGRAFWSSRSRWSPADAQPLRSLGWTFVESRPTKPGAYAPSRRHRPAGHWQHVLPTADGRTCRREEDQKDGFQITRTAWLLVAKCFGRNDISEMIERNRNQLASVTVANSDTQSSAKLSGKKQEQAENSTSNLRGREWLDLFLLTRIKVN